MLIFNTQAISDWFKAGKCVVVLPIDGQFLQANDQSLQQNLGVVSQILILHKLISYFNMIEITYYKNIIKIETSSK